MERSSATLTQHVPLKSICGCFRTLPRNRRSSDSRRRGLLDPAAVAADFSLRDLRRDHPGVERVARNVLRGGDARAPGVQRDDPCGELLAGGEVDISVLVEIAAEALPRHVVMSGWNIAI